MMEAPAAGQRGDTRPRPVLGHLGEPLCVAKHTSGVPVVRGERWRRGGYSHQGRGHGRSRSHSHSHAHGHAHASEEHLFPPVLWRGRIQCAFI